jgi:hypothetical protein
MKGLERFQALLDLRKMAATRFFALGRALPMAVLCGSLSSLPVLAVPSEDGDWSEPFALPLIAIHAAMLPTGKVLLFSAEHGVPGIH